MIIQSEILKSWVRDVFMSKGMTFAHATQCAEVLIIADLRGIDSHGVARLSGYVRLIDKDRITVNPTLVIERETPSTANLNAGGAIGLVSAHHAMQIAIEKAKNCGSGWVAISNSNHFGIAAYHAMMALEHDMIGFAITNASPLVTPANGAERMLGTNPISVAIPAGKEPAFVLDMATSAASNGKLEIAERKEVAIPEGWLIDKEGNNSKDPTELKKGGMVLTLGSDLDHGSYKGYGLSSFVDIFSGVLSGANYGPWVPPFVSFLDPLPNLPGEGIGHFVGAWRVDGFRDINAFKSNMDNWSQRFRNTKPIHPNTPVIIPGDPERKLHAERIVSGIPLIDKVVADLKTVAEQTGVNWPKA